MTKRLDELYALRDTIDKAIAHEQAQMLRMAQLRDICHELLSQQTQATADTLRAVAAAHDLNVGELLTRDRRRDLIAARAVMCAVLRSQGLSFPEIGRIVGRDHTTVMNACRRVDADPTLTATVETIREKLASSNLALVAAS